MKVKKTGTSGVVQVDSTARRAKIYPRQPHSPLPRNTRCFAIHRTRISRAYVVLTRPAIARNVCVYGRWRRSINPRARTECPSATGKHEYELALGVRCPMRTMPRRLDLAFKVGDARHRSLQACVMPLRCYT